VPLELVSHALCPYVQRAAIALHEKGVPFTRRDVDLSDKPAWFLALSPLGKTPVLVADGTPIFESAVILEFLEETAPPPLLPADPLARARERGFVAFASALLDDIAGLYGAADDAAFARKAGTIATRFAVLARELGEEPYFAAGRFGLVDAAFGPVFRYFDAFERLGLGDIAGLRGDARLPAWRAALAVRPSVARAVAPDFPARLDGFLAARRSALGRRVAAPVA